MTEVQHASHREELLFLGKECHHPACHLHDFLPFSCPACNLSFCQPHFLPSHHSCTSPLPPSMRDRIAPQCPLCSEIITSVPSGDPNEAVERHLQTGTCAGLEGGESKRKAELKARKERGEVCYRKGCAKVLVVQIKCESCHHVFCPSHRHTTSHSCLSSSSPSSSSPSSRIPTPQPVASSSTSRPSAKSAMSRLKPKSSQPTSSSSSSSPPASKPLVTPAPSRPLAHTAASTSTAQPGNSAALDAKAAAAAAALRRAGQDVKLPFVTSKTDKRAKDEHSSTIQALKARHEKGLLSKAEEIKYAELLGKNEASRRRGEGGKSGKGKDGCVIA